MKLAQKLALNYFRARLNMTAVFSRRRAAEKAFDVFCTPFRRARKAEPSIFRRAEKVLLRVDGKRVVLYRWNRGTGRRVLILHGFESSAFNFDRYVGPLLKKGYEVLALDAPAHGASEGKRITLPAYVASIAAVAATVGMPHSFMAHSFGGLALVHFLEQVKPAPADLRVALVAPATEMQTAVDSLFRLLQLDDSVRVHFEELIIEKGGHPAAHYSLSRVLPVINAAVLWVQDEQDDITPYSDMLPIQQLALPNMEFMVTSGLGHRRIYRENKVVKKIVEFL